MTKRLSRLSRTVLHVAAATVLLACSDTSDSPGSDSGDPIPGEGSISGQVRSGDHGIACIRIALYESSADYGSAALVREAGCSGEGEFSLEYNAGGAESVFYVIAEGIQGSDTASEQGAPVVFAAVFTTPYPDSIVVNERTTVAAAYAMARFIEGEQIGGPAPGMPNAADITANFADYAGEVSQVLSNSPNGSDTSTLPTFNSLANILAACVRNASQCPDLFQLATTPDGDVPANTLEAITNIAHFPGRRVRLLLEYAQREVVYTPALDESSLGDAKAPGSNKPVINSWILALRYSGQGMDGPGNIAFDSEGNAWASNNFAFAESINEIVCGSTLVVRFTPTGEDAPGAPYGGDDTIGDGKGGGGLYGAGFGMAVDGNDNAWVTNFGFQGQQPLDAGPGAPECENDAPALRVSVSRFLADGTVASPDGVINPGTSEGDMPGGYRVLVDDPDNPDGPQVDGLKMPQAVIADKRGNIWTAGCISGTVTRFRGGDPTAIDHKPFDDLDRAFDLTVDPNEHVWVTGNATNNAIEIDQDFNVVGDPVTTFAKPMGIATDSQGNLWISEAGIVNPPCPPLKERFPGELGDDGTGNRLAAAGLIRNDRGQREVEHFRKNVENEPPRKGLRWPWGIAVDGADNVWIGNFVGNRVMALCGVNTDNCPADTDTGDPLSPDDGYFHDGIERITGIQVDPSGNIWVTNNWIDEAFNNPQNPGGKELVVIVGIAEPVVTPMLGPPQRPE